MRCTFLSRIAIVATIASMLSLSLASCDKANDERIPYSTVYLPFSIGTWSVYGLSGAGDFAYFIKSKGVPAGFPYAAMHETGFGGVLLVMDYLGTPLAYSLACPVERNPDIRLSITDNAEGKPVAACSKCGSTYDVFSNFGTPLSGDAHAHKYALTRYKVTSSDAYPVIVTD